MLPSQELSSPFSSVISQHLLPRPFGAVLHPLCLLLLCSSYPFHLTLLPHDVVVSINRGPVSGTTEVSRVPHHGTAQAPPQVPRAVRRPSRNHLQWTGQDWTQGIATGSDVGHLHRSKLPNLQLRPDCKNTPCTQFWGEFFMSSSMKNT